MARVKRTRNLSERTIRTVRELSEHYSLDRSQDAVAELAVEDLERRLRHAEEARVWAAAVDDPEFRLEAEDLEAAYRSADAETWPPYPTPISAGPLSGRTRGSVRAPR